MKIEKNGVTYYGELAEFITNTPKEDLFYYKLIEKITDQIDDIMEKKDISRAQLAERLGLSRASITQSLDGNTNFTLKKLARYLTALDADIELKIIDKDEPHLWACYTRRKTQQHELSKARLDTYASFQSRMAIERDIAMKSEPVECDLLRAS